MYGKTEEASTSVVLAHNYGLSNIAHLAVSAIYAQRSNNGCIGFCLFLFGTLHFSSHLFINITITFW